MNSKYFCIFQLIQIFVFSSLNKNNIYKIKIKYIFRVKKQILLGLKSILQQIGATILPLWYPSPTRMSQKFYKISDINHNSVGPNAFYWDCEGDKTYWTVIPLAGLILSECFLLDLLLWHGAWPQNPQF